MTGTGEVAVRALHEVGVAMEAAGMVAVKDIVQGGEVLLRESPLLLYQDACRGRGEQLVLWSLHDFVAACSWSFLIALHVHVAPPPISVAHLASKALTLLTLLTLLDSARRSAVWKHLSWSHPRIDPSRVSLSLHTT